MLRHRKIGVFTALALALVMLTTMAAPTSALNKEGTVVVKASYPAVLEVQFPATPMEFPTIPYGPTAVYPYHIDNAMVFTVTSNLPYATKFSSTIDTLTWVEDPTAWQGLFFQSSGYGWNLTSTISVWSNVDAHIGGPRGIEVDHTANMELRLDTSPLAPGELQVTIVFKVSQA